MFYSKISNSTISCMAVVFITASLAGMSYAQQADAADAKTATATTTSTKLPVQRGLSLDNLAKYKQVKVSTEEKGKKVEYSGVPLRVIFAEMLPEFKLDSMPEWKELSRHELVVELMGDDGYPGLVTATELAMNKDGDRFVLAIKKDGKPSPEGVHLICKMDEAHLRSLHSIVSMRIVQLPKK